MFEGTINISELVVADTAFNTTYIKDVAGDAKLYIYIPYISYTAATLRALEKTFSDGLIPLSAYNQALINAPLGISGEFETTESVNLPAASDVYQAVLDTQDATLIGAVSPTNTLAQLASNLLAQGYLITFDNKDMFLNNTAVSLTVRTITADDTLTASDDIIEIDATSNPVELTLTATSTKGIGIKRIDKTNNKASIIVTGGGTIDGQDCLVIDTITSNEPDLYIQLYYSTTDSEYKIIA